MFLNSVKNNLSILWDYLKNPVNYKKILYTLSILALYKVLTYIPLPGLDLSEAKLLAASKKMQENLSTFDILTGGSISRFSIASIGVGPTITAGIVLQVGSVLYPPLAKLKNEAIGRELLNKYKKFLVLIFSFAYSFVYVQTLMFYQHTKELVFFENFDFVVIGTLVFATTSYLIFWLADQINERGFGDGVSFIIYAGIISFASHIVDKVYAMSWQNLASLLVFWALLFFVIFGQKMYKNLLVYKSDNNLEYVKPIKLNSAGIYPAIFADTIVSGIIKTLKFFHLGQYSVGAWILSHLQISNDFYIFLSSIVILLTTYIYSEHLFNPKETSENLKKSHVIIKDVEYQNYEKFFKDILAVLSVIGGFYLAFACAVPNYVYYHYKDNLFLYFGGTSFVIVSDICISIHDQIAAGLIQTKNQKLSFEKKEN